MSDVQFYSLGSGVNGPSWMPEAPTETTISASTSTQIFSATTTDVTTFGVAIEATTVTGRTSLNAIVNSFDTDAAIVPFAQVSLGNAFDFNVDSSLVQDWFPFEMQNIDGVYPDNSAIPTKKALLVKDNNFYMYGNGSYILSSTDYVTWTTFNSNTFDVTGGYGLMYHNNLWHSYGPNSSHMGRSTDGITWVTVGSNATGRSYLNYTNAAYGNGRWVGVREWEGAVTSTDLLTWTTLTANSSLPNLPGSCRDVWYGDGKWLAISNQAFVTSTDGLTWVTGTTNGSVNYWPSGIRVRYVNNSWAVVNESTVFFSTDALTWVSRDIGYGDGGAIISYINNEWFIQRSIGSNSTRFVHSTDTLTWVTVSMTDWHDTSHSSYTHRTGTSWAVRDNRLYVSDGQGQSRTRYDFTGELAINAVSETAVDLPVSVKVTPTYIIAS